MLLILLRKLVCLVIIPNCVTFNTRSVKANNFLPIKILRGCEKDLIDSLGDDLVHVLISPNDCFVVSKNKKYDLVVY